MSLKLELSGSGGSLRSSIIQHLARLIKSTHTQVTFVLETRNSKITATQLVNFFPIKDSFVVPAAGLSGGLWVLWTDDVDLKFLLLTTMC
jgi:hypothetical protein